MGNFETICEKCGCKMLYEYQDDDLDIGKIKIKKLCFNCIK